MANIIEGLTKNQVKQIVKISKKKELSGRTNLQGLLYQSEYKYLFVTDGYIAVSWDMNSLLTDILPTEDVRISYQSLNAWCANSKPKDILKWTELFDMAKPEPVPDMHSIIDKFNYTDDLPASRVNPALLGEILPLFSEPVDISVVAEYKNTSPAVKLVMDESKYDIKYNQTGVIMGIKK